MDKKIFQKLTKYEDDKRMLYGLYLKDQANPSDEDINLDFQSDNSKHMFVQSIPEYIKDWFKQRKTQPDQADSDDFSVTISFDEKLKQVYPAIGKELELYEILKNLKKEKNKIKRMPIKNRISAQDEHTDQTENCQLQMYDNIY